MAGSQGAELHSVFNKDSVVSGHHIYKTYWTPVVGEELRLETEEDNKYDEHAAAVMKDGYIVGQSPLTFSSHIPQPVSRTNIITLSLRHCST